MKFLPHVPQKHYTAGALAAALYLVSGVRSMERGTISMDRDEQGNDVLADLELCRMALPRRVYTMSHVDYVVDRLGWLYAHRDLVGGLEFYEEPTPSGPISATKCSIQSCGDRWRIADSTCTAMVVRRPAIRTYRAGSLSRTSWAAS
jgi:hypothetical protein